MASLEHAIRSAEQFKRDQQAGQDDLFGSPTQSNDTNKPKFIQAQPWSDATVLQGEKETLGLYLTGHPIDRYLQEIKQVCRLRLASLQPTKRGDYVRVAGLIVDIRVMKTKKGLNWAIVTLDDKSGRVDLMVYNELFEASREYLRKDEVVVAKGDIAHDDYSGGLKMSAIEINEFNQMRESQSDHLQIKLNFSQSPSLATDVIASLTPYKGGLCPVRFDCRLDNLQAELIASGDWSVKPTDELLFNLSNLNGCEGVEVIYQGQNR